MMLLRGGPPPGGRRSRRRGVEGRSPRLWAARGRVRERKLRRQSACVVCNRHKGPNLAGIDRRTSPTKLVRLFHPRRHRWAYHFLFSGPRVEGRTAIGRVTVHVLAMNAPVRVGLRAELIAEGVWPPAG